MAFTSIFTNGACAVEVRLHVNEGGVQWSGSLALSGEHTFDDTDNPGITYTIAVDADGEVTLTKSAAIGGSPDSWEIDITPPSIVGDMEISGMGTNADANNFFLQMRPDGSAGDNLGDGPTYSPDPYPFSPRPTTSVGVYVLWTGA